MEEKITLVAYMNEGRKKALAEGCTEGELRSPTDALGCALHDIFCLSEDHSENIAFTVILTEDGEPFIDWKLHTYDEWRDQLQQLTSDLIIESLLRGLLG